SHEGNEIAHTQPTTNHVRSAVPQYNQEAEARYRFHEWWEQAARTREAHTFFTKGIVETPKFCGLPVFADIGTHYMHTTDRFLDSGRQRSEPLLDPQRFFHHLPAHAFDE